MSLLTSLLSTSLLSIDGIVYIDTMDPGLMLEQFDAYLAERGLRFEGIVIGGSALRLLGLTTRDTRDCDVLVPALPAEVAAAADAFAADKRASGVALRAGWFNDRPATLANELPPGWERDVQPLFAGRALALRTLGRLDLLRSKLYALCDRGRDLDDCLALRPSAAELQVIEPWLVARDANPGWPGHARGVLDDLARRLGLHLNLGGRGRGL